MKKARIRQTDRIGVQIFSVVWVTLSLIFSLIPLYVTILNSLKPHPAVQENIFSFAISWEAITENFSVAFGRSGGPC